MINLSKQQEATGQSRAQDWRKAMSDHVAWALLIYTGLTIFVTIKALEQGTSSILPYMALIFLVAAIIPACRWFEKRWSGLNGDDAITQEAPAGFRRDTVGLWLMAIGMPFALTGLFKAILALA